jgi:hypothetical protein
MNHEKIMLYIIVFIYNAILLGWNIKKIGAQSYELTKKNIDIKNNLTEIVEQIIKID